MTKDDTNTARTAGRKTLHVDSAAKARNSRRLRRIAGQVRGLEQMVADDRYCADILMQIASVNEALRSLARELMRHHLRHCVTQGLGQGSARRANNIYNELLELVRKYPR